MHYEIELKIGEIKDIIQCTFAKSKTDALMMANDYVRMKYGVVDYKVLKIRRIDETEINIGY